MPDGLAALCQQFQVRQLDLFGSAADGRFDPARSDIDMIVTFEDPSAPEYANRWFGLLDGLTGLFGRKVDLLTDASIQNPFFRAEVESQRRQVYPAP